MKKIGVCGHFGGNREFLDGQTVKTKIVASELKRIYGESEIKIMDTYGGAKKVISHFLKLWKLIADCKNIFILPAQNAVKLFVPYLVFLNRFYKKKLHYIVIGGWLPKLASSNKFLSNNLKKFDYIYVETSTMKKKLEKLGYKNIKILPNCKNLNILHENELIYCEKAPFKLCTFSRVTKKKGIEDAIKAVDQINSEQGKVVFVLDVYGQIDSSFEKEFDEILQRHSKYIQYKGCVPFDESVNVLKEYYALLFPTRFYTEGIPGTIIDAYAAGVPILSSKWESFSDVIDEGVVGMGYAFGDNNALKDLLIQIYDNPGGWNNMKKNCLKKAQQFNASMVVGERINVT